MRVTIKTPFEPTKIIKPWGRALRAFDAEEKGGYALVGEHFFIDDLVTHPDGSALRAHTAHPGPFYLSFTSEETAWRYGFAFMPIPLAASTFSSPCILGSVEFTVETEGCKLVCASSDFSFHDGQVSHEDWANFFVAQGITNNLGRGANLHYRIALWLNNRGQLPAGKDGKAVNPAQPADLLTAQKVVYKYDKWDKGSEKLAEKLNARVPLPDRMRWAGTIGGIWLVTLPDDRMRIAASVLAKMFAVNNPNPDFLALLAEQAELLSGSGAIALSLKNYYEAQQNG